MVRVSAELGERLSACAQQYSLHFAGQVRLTRDPHILTSLLVELEEIEQLARSYDDADQVRAAREQAALLRREQTQLEAALQEAGPRGRATAHLAQRASLMMHRYSRHFAGQGRAGRDLGLLAEIGAQLQASQRALQPLHPGQAHWVAEFVAMCTREQQAILAARQQGSLAQQAASHATAANTLMQTYVDCCVERRRLAVRPALLQRLLAQLQRCGTSMAELRAAGLDLPHHASSLTAIEQQAQNWRQEAAQLEAAHECATSQEHHEALSGELDDLLQQYNRLCDEAGSSLPAPAALGVLCDRLGELDQQFERLAGMLPQAEVAAEGQVVRDALAMLCQRFDDAATGDSC